jgi:hypothetical protein
MRNVLPQRRYSETFDLTHEGHTFQVSIGYFPVDLLCAGLPAEVFISGSKVGSYAEGVARDASVVVSIALQHGVPLDVMRKSITRNADGAPQTIIGAVLDRLEEST